jgi:hypothetical protein
MGCACRELAVTRINRAKKRKRDLRGDLHCFGIKCLKIYEFAAAKTLVFPATAS